MKLGIGVAFLLGLFACAAARDEDAKNEGLNVEADELAAACPRPLPAADRKRKVVVSHPFGDNPNRYEVLDLDRRGRLTPSGATFEMDRASSSKPIAFTPDGKIGVVVQERGTLGVFRFDEQGRVTVVERGFQGDFFARSVAMDPTGARVYVADGNTEANGGGVYEVAIGCDGHLTSRGRIVPGGTAHALTFLPRDNRRAFLAAGKAFDSGDNSDTFVVDLRRPALIAQADGFGDHSAIVSSVAVTNDGKHALVADDGLAVGNRIAVVALPSMQPKQMLKTKAPFALATSPWDNAALVVNGDSCDEITTLRYDAGNTAEPFTDTGPLAYTAPRPQLPGAAVMIARGALKGRVLVAELMAVRQVQFTREGAVTDVEQTRWESSIENIVGTVGVQP